MHVELWDKGGIMPIKYYVVKSPFRENEYFARTLLGDVFTMEDAIGNILQETALTESEIHGVNVAVARQRDEALLRGQSVDFGPLGTYSLRVKATMSSPDEPLPQDASVDVLFGLPRQTRKSLRDRATFDRADRAPFQPVIDGFFEPVSKQENAVYVAGGVARLTGKYLTFDADDPEQGVFFVAEDDTAVRVVAYLDNSAKRVNFGVPAGLTGAQSVEVRTRRKEGGALLASDPFGPLNPA
jgi:hypothetical protein